MPESPATPTRSGHDDDLRPRAVAVIARREWAAYLRAPAGWAVLALFLALQGIVFWMFLQFLGRPDAPPGGVMEFFFGGTILYWIALALLATVVPMRLLAEELRAGTIEPLLTAPVTPAELVLGKWLAACAFYLCAWAPTLLYLAYLRAVGAHLDPGPIAAGYLGTALLGAATMAVGLLASSLTRNQLVAATASFVAFFVVLLAGVLEAQVRSPGVAGALRRLSLFRVMEDFGHGIVDTRHVVLLGTGAALALVGAVAAVGRLRGPAPADAPRSTRAPRVLIPALLAIIALLVNALGGRYYARGDWTRDRLYALSDRTVSVLRALPRDVQATVFLYPGRDTEQGRALAGLVRELGERFGGTAPARFHLDVIDPDRDPARVEAAQKKYAVSAADMNEGVVVFTSAGRVRVVTRADLVDPEIAPDGTPGPAIHAWKGEEAFLAAVLTVTEDRPAVICFAKGHGEPDIESFADGGYSSFAEQIRRDGDDARAIAALAPAVPADCTVLVVAEPQQAFTDGELAAVDAFLRRGGRLLVMMGPVFNREGTGFAHVGIEALAARWGVRLGDNLVVDPAHASDVEGPSVWAASGDAYAEHPVTARLGGRVTYWPRTRQVTTAAAPPGVQARAVVHGSASGWAETDLATIRGDADLAFDAGRDQHGPVDVAVAVDAPGTRLLFLGTGRLVMNVRLEGLMLRDYDADLVLSGLAWLTAREQRAGVGPKIPARVALALDEGQVAWAFRLFALGVPLACLAAAALVWRRRRV
jgi:ABC-2 type transport system permease protein